MMAGKKENPAFARVWVMVPKVFLDHFDTEIEKMFTSRSEAIRRGMNLILDEVKAYREKTEEASE